MASLNFNFNFFDNWFTKPSNPIPLLNLNLNPTPPSLSPTSHNPPTFASLTSLFTPKKKNPDNDPDNKKDGIYTQMLDQFWWECDNLPDHRHAPKVEKILNEDPFFETKENPTEEEVKENERWWEEFRSSPIVKFMMRAEEIADKVNELELQENAEPYMDEDKKLWQAIPHVTGLDGRPMPRKAIRTKKESDDKFWDFARQFFFGLWGFRQRPYPPGRPIDVAQAIGYKQLERRYYDCKFCGD